MPKFVTSDGEKIFYEVLGSSGEPLLFIHPPLMGHVVFNYQKKLQARFRVILMDLRGHGRSNVHSRNFHMARNVEDMRELLDHLDIRKAALVGYSAGGSLVLDLALKHPDRVSHIILSGGFPKVATWLLQKEFQIGIALMEKQKVTFLSKVLASSHKVTDKDQKELSRYGKRANPEAVGDLYRECLVYNCVDQLHRLAGIPTMVLYGQYSYHINAHAEWFKKHLPSAKIGFIDRGTHQLPTRYHGPFNHAIIYFLKQRRE